MGEAANSQVGWITSGFEQFERSLNGERQSDIHQVREKAFKAFNATGLPTTKDEAWKYTNVASLRGGAFGVATDATDVFESDIESFLIPGVKNRFVFVNGQFNELLSVVNIDSGVTVTPLKRLFSDKDPARVQLRENYFSKIASFENDPFVAVNTAFVRDGACIEIAKGARIEEPVQLLFLCAARQSSVAVHPRVLIVAHESSSCSVVETFGAVSGDAYLTTAVTEVAVAENAQLRHYRLQREATESQHFSVVKAEQKAHSTFQTYCFGFGGQLVRNDVQITLQGQAAFAGLFGLTVLEDSQHTDNHTVLDHAEAHCESKEIYKGIYDDKSKGIFNGTIIVRPGAQKTNAIQSNQSLLLSSDAVSNAKPQLKIWADDVRCTHGATVGQLDDDAMFYLRSRGVPKKHAHKMLTLAFAGEVIDEIQNDSIRQVVTDLLNAKLEA